MKRKLFLFAIPLAFVALAGMTLSTTPAKAVPVDEIEMASTGAPASKTLVASHYRTFNTCFRVRPVGVRPIRVRPIGVRPIRVRPINVRPVRVRPFTVRPFNVRPFNVRPISVRPIRVRPINVRPFNVRSFNVRSFRSYRR